MLLHHAASRGAALKRRGLLLLSVLSVLCSVGFVLAPVDRPHAVYSWPAGPGDARPVAVPLMLHVPADLQASVSCAAARAAEPGAVLLSTTPLDPRPGVEALPGLQVSVDQDRRLLVTSAGSALPAQPVPAAGDCTWALDTDVAATTLRQDGEVVASRSGDLRPTVAGVFSGADSPDGLSVDVTADTVFQTSPSPLKIVLGVLAALALGGVLLLLARTDRAHRSTPALQDGSPPDRRAGAAASTSTGPGAGSAGRAVRRLTDAAVVGTLALWTAIGPITVDDGYIAGIIRSRDANGYVGNVFRWFNAPEAPFGWHYEVLDAWSAVSEATVWMRVPAMLLGVLTWFVLSRGLVPRLGRLAPGRLTVPLAALVFAAWWLPTNAGMRPEPWVAAGLVTVVVLVERGLARERLLPVALAVVVAAATLAVNPIGAVAVLPLVAAVVPVLRLCRDRTSAGLPTFTAVALAAGASTLLLMFADQTPSAIALANTVRADLPGALPWSQEAERWYLLLDAEDIQGALERRVPVLLTLLAVLGIVWRRSRLAPPARAVVDRLVTTAALSLVVLTFTPTKWTLHFGSFAATGSALVLVALHLFWRNAERPVEAAGRRGPARWTTGALTAATAGLSLVLLVAAFSYEGRNQWAYLSNLQIPWNDMPPEVLRVRFSSLFLAGAAPTTAVSATVRPSSPTATRTCGSPLPAGSRRPPWSPSGCSA